MPPLPEASALPSAFDEEVARAELYGLLAVLYYAPPASALLARLRLAVTQAPLAGAVLEAPWRALVGSACALSDAAIQQEYDALFGGLGQPEVCLYGSHFLSGFLNEKPLVRLRTDLQQLGLARAEQMHETEDHVACLCEVMRTLAGADEDALVRLQRQRSFFATHLQPWVPMLCDVLEPHPRARFYADLAALTRCFITVEAQGFTLTD